MNVIALAISSLLVSLAPAPLGDRDGSLSTLRERGALVRPVARDLAVLDVDLHLGARDAGDEVLTLVGELGADVERLNLRGTKVGDEGLARLASLRGLRFLDLTDTAVTGRGLEALSGLPIEVLILVGTKVGDEAVAPLAAIESLRRVYLWRTGLGEEAAVELALSRPDLRLDRGADAEPLPGTTPPSAEEIAQARERILALGGAIRPLSQDGDEVEVDFHLGSSTVTDEDLALLRAVPGLSQLHLGGRPITDAGLRHLRSVPGLRRLYLQNTAITDAGLASLRSLRKLEYLNLFGDHLGDAGLAQLSGLRSLRQLYVWGTEVSYEGAEDLAAAIPGVVVDRGFGAPGPPAWQRPSEEDHAAAVAQLEALGAAVRRLDQASDDVEVDFHLSARGVTDEQLAPLERIPNLVEIDLSGCRGVTGAGLAHLAALPDLERLHLDGSGVGDDGLDHLRYSRKLRYLNLYGTAVGDAGLGALRRMRSLERLYLWQTQVTTEGAKRLEAALPNLEILFGWDLSEAEPTGTCCELASARGVACEHPCCQAAAAKGRSCFRCNPGKAVTCCEVAESKGEECGHPCCVEARANGTLCAKCNPGR